MRADDSASGIGQVTLSPVWWGFVGVVAFSGTLPATRLGALAREMPGWQVISWALLLSAPVLVPVSAVGLALRPPHAAGLAAWLAFGYVCVVSMFLGFFAWYRGLARGGVARIGQVQLAQPVLTLGLAVLLLGEHISLATALSASVVLVCTLTQRTRWRGVTHPRSPGPTPHEEVPR